MVLLCVFFAGSARGFAQKAEARENKLVESRFIGTVVVKPKATLCEPWETMPVFISGAREAGDISISRSEF